MIFFSTKSHFLLRNTGSVIQIIYYLNNVKEDTYNAAQCYMNAKSHYITESHDLRCIWSVLSGGLSDLFALLYVSYSLCMLGRGRLDVIHFACWERKVYLSFTLQAGERKTSCHLHFKLGKIIPHVIHIASWEREVYMSFTVHAGKKNNTITIAC